MKTITFEEKAPARYLKMDITSARGNFGSGREMYIFKVPGTETVLQGDINHDGRIDMDDFTSYMNYTGLRAGDSDFDGYISGGDINKNGSINGADAVTLLSFIADGAADTVQAIADVDDNGRVDANDALRSMQYAAGWNVTLK